MYVFYEAFLTAFVWKPDLQKEELVSQHQVSGISGSLHLEIGFGFFRNKFNKYKVFFFFFLKEWDRGDLDHTR